MQALSQMQLLAAYSKFIGDCKNRFHDEEKGIFYSLPSVIDMQRKALEEKTGTTWKRHLILDKNSAQVNNRAVAKVTFLKKSLLIYN